MSLALVSVVSFVSLPSLYELSTHTTLRAGAAAFGRFLEQAQNIARERDEELALHLQRQSYEVSTLSGLQLREHLDSSLEFLPPAMERNYHFYPSGVVSPQTFRLGNGRKVCEVVLSLRGRVHVLCP